MKAIGQITIEEGLTLNNPTLEIKTIQYEQFDDLVSVECIFTEEGANYKHSRNYTFTAVKDMLKSDVIELLKTNDILNLFV